MPQQCYIGIDFGAESGRVMAGLFDGEKIELQELHRFPNGAVSMGGTMRWDVIRLWAEVKQGLAAAAQKYGDEIVSVGVDTWGVDYVLFSKNMEMLGQPFHYRDARTQGMLDAAFQTVSRKEIFAESGLQFMELNTLYQLLATQKNTPELLENADCLLMMPDFFHWCLSGEKVCEFTEASTSQIVNPVTKCWSKKLLDRFGLPSHIFPRIVAPGTRIGVLSEDVRRETGLAAIDVVVPASHDTGSAVAAVPTKNTGKPNWAYLSSGTWSLLGVEIQEAILNDDVLDLNFTNEGGVDGTYRFLKNIMGLWLVQQSKRSFERQGNALDYAALTQLAADAAPFRSIVNVDDPRFLNPSDMPEAIQQFCQETGQPIPESEGQIVRCALESLALKYNAVIESIEKITGTPIEVIHIVGGGSQNRLLNQLAADACAKPVVTGPIEATVLGNVLVQARAAGQIGSLAEIRDVVRRSCDVETFEPDPSQAWNEARQRFASLST